MGEKDREKILLRLLREKAGDVPHATYFEGLRERIVVRLTDGETLARSSGRERSWNRPFVPAILGSATALALLVMLRPGDNGLDTPSAAPGGVAAVADSASTNSPPEGVFDPPGGGVTYPASFE